MADLDHNSKIAGESDKDTYWMSYLRSAQLSRDPETGKYSITWQKSKEIKGYIAEKGRAMELSTLINYNNKLLTCCDRTGIGLMKNTLNPKSTLFFFGKKCMN